MNLNELLNALRDAARDWDDEVVVVDQDGQAFDITRVRFDKSSRTLIIDTLTDNESCWT